MSRQRPDFITVKLSEAGQRMAGEAGTLGWANGRRHFHFVAGEPQEVERSYEWNYLLRHERFEGEPILEEVSEELPVEQVIGDRTVFDKLTADALGTDADKKAKAIKAIRDILTAAKYDAATNATADDLIKLFGHAMDDAAPYVDPTGEKAKTLHKAIVNEVKPIAEIALDTIPGVIAEGEDASLDATGAVDTLVKSTTRKKVS